MSRLENIIRHRELMNGEGVMSVSMKRVKEDLDYLLARTSRFEKALKFYAYEIDWMRIDMNRGQKLRQIARTALEDGE